MDLYIRLDNIQKFAILEIAAKRIGKFSMVTPGKEAEVNFFSEGHQW
jgi:hypothetical protein